MRSNSKIKNITRHHYKNPFGWAVRIQFAQKSYAKFFSDDKFGGENSALLSAISWRDDKKKEIGMPLTNLNVMVSTRSNTGVQGVSYSENNNRYLVSWKDAEGRPNCTTLSCLKHGKAKAFKLACKIRKEMEEWRLNGNVLPENRRKASLNRNNRRYSREELIEILVRTKEQLGRLPTSRDFKKTKPNYGRYETKFGGWNKALVAAGLKEDVA